MTSNNRLSFPEYIDLEDCPDFNKNVTAILVNNGTTDILSDLLNKHVYPPDDFVTWENLIEDLSNSKCLEEYVISIQDGSFRKYLQELNNPGLDNYLKKINDSTLVKDFICKISYILTNIVPADKIGKYVLMGGEIINGLSNQCANCGISLRVGLLYLMLYNGISSADVLEIFSHSFGKKICCKRSILDNINLILTPYVNAAPLTRKYIIESFEDDILEEIGQENIVPEIGEITPVSSVYRGFSFDI